MSTLDHQPPDPVHLLVGRIWDIWSKDHGVINIHDLLPGEFVEIEEAAKFVGVSGRRADELVSNENGYLFIIDSCGQSHAVDPLRFVAIPPNVRDHRAGPEMHRQPEQTIVAGSGASTSWADAQSAREVS